MIKVLLGTAVYKYEGNGNYVMIHVTFHYTAAGPQTWDTFLFHSFILLHHPLSPYLFFVKAVTHKS